MAWPHPLRAPIDFFGRFKTHRAWALVIGIINLVGIAYGFYYYREQFATTPWWLWIFVPDSPLAVLWAELALIAFWLGRPSRLLDALAFVGNVQVGLWTCYALLAYAPEFGTLDFLSGGPLSLNTVLLVGHFGMAVLALIFVQGLRDEPDRARVRLGILVALAYYLVNDALDYFGPDYDPRHLGCGLRPVTVPCHLGAPETTLTVVTFGLTLASAAALWLLARPRRA